MFGIDTQVSGLRSQVSGLRSQVSGLRSEDSVLECLWGVLGPLWVSLELFYALPKGSLGDGSSNPEAPIFLQVRESRPTNPIRHDLSNLSFRIIR